MHVLAVCAARRRICVRRHNEMKQIKNNLLLLLTALIWGCAFVAQSVGMEYVGPFTFNSVRCILGSIVLIPVIFLMEEEERHERRRDEKRAGRQKDAPDRGHLLRRGSGSGQQPAAVRNPVYHGGEGRVHHGHVYCPGSLGKRSGR